MANPNDRYRGAPTGYQSGYTNQAYNDTPPYLGSGLDEGDDRPRLKIPAGQQNDFNYYNPQYGARDQAGSSLQRSVSAAPQPSGSYFNSPPGNSEGSGYNPQQQQRGGYEGGYQQQQNFDSAPYPQTPVYNGSDTSPHQPYNPANYTGLQRHATTAGYPSSGPPFSPVVGPGYNPSSFNTAPYPTFNTTPKVVPQQQYATSTYNQYPGRPTYTPQPQQSYGAPQTQQQYSSPAQSAYRAPPPPPPPRPHPHPPLRPPALDNRAITTFRTRHKTLLLCVTIHRRRLSGRRPTTALIVKKYTRATAVVLS